MGILSKKVMQGVAAEVTKKVVSGNKDRIPTMGIDQMKPVKVGRSTIGVARPGADMGTMMRGKVGRKKY